MPPTPQLTHSQDQILFRPRVGLKNAEGISFCIHEVSLPADSRHCEFGHGHDTAGPHNFRCGGIVVFDFHRTDEGIGSVLGRRRFGRTLQQAATRTVGFDTPIFDRKTFNLLEIPSEDFSVEPRSTIAIVGLNFELVWHVHRPSIIEKAVGASSSQSFIGVCPR